MPAATVSRDVALVLERVEAEAWRDWYAAAAAEDRAALGIRTHEVEGALALSVDADESLLSNRTLGVGLAAPATDGLVDALLAHYAGHAAGFAINLCPFAEPAGLERALAARGFGTFFHHLKWVRGAEPPHEAPSELRVEVVAAGRSAAWARLSARIRDSTPAHAAWAARVVGRARWTHYWALDGDEPVAVGALFVHDGAAWLGMAATLESHRRRGAQSALFAHRVRDALAQGARWLCTETAPDWPELGGQSLRNAARAGFHPAYARPSWIFPLSR